MNNNEKINRGPSRLQLAAIIANGILANHAGSIKQNWYPTLANDSLAIAQALIEADALIAAESPQQPVETPAVHPNVSTAIGWLESAVRRLGAGEPGPYYDVTEALQSLRLIQGQPVETPNAAMYEALRLMIQWGEAMVSYKMITAGDLPKGFDSYKAALAAYENAPQQPQHTQAVDRDALQQPGALSKAYRNMQLSGDIMRLMDAVVDAAEKTVQAAAPFHYSQFPKPVVLKIAALKARLETYRNALL